MPKIELLEIAAILISIALCLTVLTYSILNKQQKHEYEGLNMFINLDDVKILEHKLSNYTVGEVIEGEIKQCQEHYME